jgi:hypothetical protein
LKIVASEEVAPFVAQRGGKLWIWFDPHQWLGTATVYLMTSTAPLGTTRQTRRTKSARRPHRFHEFPAEGFTILFDHGRMALPEELHLAMKGWGKHRHVAAFWNGAIFVGEDVPPPSHDS